MSTTRKAFLDQTATWFHDRHKILVTKGEAYSGLDNPFDNFERNAEYLGLTKYQVWAVYAFKHIDSIRNAIKQNPDAPVDKSEGLAGRIEDAQNYLDLLRGMLVDDAKSTVDLPK